MRILIQTIAVIVAVIITASFSDGWSLNNVNDINFSKDNQYAPVIVDEITYFRRENGYPHSLKLTFSDTAILLIAHNFWWY